MLKIEIIKKILRRHVPMTLLILSIFLTLVGAYWLYFIDNLSYHSELFWNITCEGLYKEAWSINPRLKYSHNMVSWAGIHKDPNSLPSIDTNLYNLSFSNSANYEQTGFVSSMKDASRVFRLMSPRTTIKPHQ